MLAVVCCALIGVRCVVCVACCALVDDSCLLVAAS